MAYTLEVAKRIANYGADKMEARGYKIERMKNCENGFYVDRPATEEEPTCSYVVGILGDFTDCNCPFHAENKVCKHTVACQRFVAEEAHYNALCEEFEAMEDARKEEEAWAEFDAARREVATENATVASAWDCPTCGTMYFEDDDEEPIIQCYTCEKRALR